MDKPKPINYHEFDTPRPEEFPMNPSVASATELTGLMYRTPVSEEEWENLQGLSPMETPPAQDLGYTRQTRENAPSSRSTSGETITP